MAEAATLLLKDSGKFKYVLEGAIQEKKKSEF